MINDFLKFLGFWLGFGKILFFSLLEFSDFFWLLWISLGFMRFLGFWDFFGNLFEKLYFCITISLIIFLCKSNSFRFCDSFGPSSTHCNHINSFVST